MAPRPTGDAGDAARTQPPSLDAIRLKGPRPKGLRKPAVLLAAAGGLGVVLLMASGAFSGAPPQGPDVRPLMSDPARRDMIKGALRDLPADYAQAGAPNASPHPAPIPQLGPPLPGDVAAFALPDPALRGYAPQSDFEWAPTDRSPAFSALDPAVAESNTATRSGLFFSLREPPAQSAAPAPQSTPTPQSSQRSLMTVVAVQDHGTILPYEASRALFPGAVIPASLVTELNSETPGPVIAQVTQAIYDSATGRDLLIPQGARLMGEYRSSARYGENRVAIGWSRLVMPDGREIALDEAAVDPSGAAGVRGEVDNHWSDVFGAAFLGTLINIGVATTEDPHVAYGGGFVSRDPVDSAMADGIQRGTSTVTTRVVDRGLAVPPTLRLPAGARLSVIVTRLMRF